MVSVKVSAARQSIALAPGLPTVLDFPEKSVETATVGDVKEALEAKYPKFHSSRQKITLKGEKKLLKDEITLQQVGVTDGGELVVKDLGPQISWRTVFIIEYIGPLLIHPLIYHFPGVFYGGRVQHSQLQFYVYILTLLHFAKRVYETIYVHRFSHGTMPLINIFRNSAHYWILSGLFFAYDMYRPSYSASSPFIRNSFRNDPIFLWSCILVWTVAEIANYQTHLTLRDLRPEGTKKRGIPYGFGFNFVSCPNYTFEIIAWIAVIVMSGSLGAVIFLAVGAYTMTLWAIKKHKTYKKEFGKEYPRNRKIIFPFIF